MIGGIAGPRHQQQLRPELQRHHDADRRGALMGELGQDQPVLGGALHPGADVRYQRTRCPYPVVVVRQRAKRADHVCRGSLPPRNLPNQRARNRPMRSPPRPSAATSAVSLRAKSPTRQTRRYPITRLKKPQRRLTIELDKPWPGGFAKGDWNGSPLRPATRWGIALVRKAPPKK